MSYCCLLRRFKQRNTIFVLAQSFSRKWSRSWTVRRGYGCTSSKTLGTSPAVSGALPRISENLLKVSKNNVTVNNHLINEREPVEGERCSSFLLPSLVGWMQHTRWEVPEFQGSCVPSNVVGGVKLSCFLHTLLVSDTEEKIVSSDKCHQTTVCCMCRVISVAAEVPWAWPICHRLQGIHQNDTGEINGN